MAVPSPFAKGITTDEVRREVAARLRRRRRAYAGVFLAVVAFASVFIAVRLWTNPEWWVYNTGCGIAMILGAAVILWLIYGARRAKLLEEFGRELFERK